MEPMSLKATRLAFASLGTVLPEPMERVAERLYFTARRHRTPERERGFLEDALPFTVSTAWGAVRAWRWEPLLPWERAHRGTVLLVHGWEGRASQLASFVSPLLDRGFSVVGADAPGPRLSPGGAVDLPTLVEILGDVERAVRKDGSDVRAVIGHSFGSAATTLALEAELFPRADAAVLVAPPCALDRYADVFARTLRLTPATEAIFRGRLEQRFGKQWWVKFALDRRAQSIDVPALVVHDVDDAETPFSEGEQLARAWAGSRLMATSGLGHRRVLRDEAVVASVTEFIDERVGRPS